MSRAIGPFASIRLALAFVLLVAHTVTFTAGARWLNRPDSQRAAAHSALSTSIGSTRVTRRARNQAASNAAATSGTAQRRTPQAGARLNRAAFGAEDAGSLRRGADRRAAISVQGPCVSASA
jgi:hypothetical protein